MKETVRILLVGGPMYDSLYTRLREFEQSEGVKVEVAAALAHPELNERIEEEFSSGAATYDLISTHSKYAPDPRAGAHRGQPLRRPPKPGREVALPPH
jgi:multiple sugar transport system substrate-binding protein